MHFFNKEIEKAFSPQEQWISKGMLWELEHISICIFVDQHLDIYSWTGFQNTKTACVKAAVYS